MSVIRDCRWVMRYSGFRIWTDFEVCCTVAEVRRAILVLLNAFFWSFSDWSSLTNAERNPRKKFNFLNLLWS